MVYMRNKEQDNDVWGRLKKRPSATRPGLAVKSKGNGTRPATAAGPVSSGKTRASHQKSRIHAPLKNKQPGHREVSGPLADVADDVGRDDKSPKSRKKLDWMPVFTSAKKYVAPVVFGGLILAAGIYLSHDGAEDDQPENVAGVQDSVGQNGRIPDVVVLDDPGFDPVFPVGMTADDFERKMTKKSPSGDPIFDYEDSLNGVPIQVTQQMLPEPLSASPSTGLEEIAGTYQLSTLTVTPDKEYRIFYGISGRDGVQSLVTLIEEQNILVFIRSPQPLAESLWHEYINSLE